MNKIIDEFFIIKEREKKQEQAFETYMKVVAPTSYTPFLENSETTAFLKGIEFYNKELSDLLSRWIYDANENGKIVLDDGTEYIIKDKEGLLTYIKERIGK